MDTFTKTSVFVILVILSIILCQVPARPDNLIIFGCQIPAAGGNIVLPIRSKDGPAAVKVAISICGPTFKMWKKFVINSKECKIEIDRIRSKFNKPTDIPGAFLFVTCVEDKKQNS